MSQAIKKLQSGGSVSQTEQKPKEETPQVKTFKLGEREIEASSLLRNADSNFESYLESTGWSSKKKNAFRESYGKYLQGINAGTISSRDLGRNWIDSTGQLTNTSGKGFDANGAVAHYLDSIADTIPDYVKEETVQPTSTKKALNFGAGLDKSLLDKFFGGNKYNQSVWYSRDALDETTKKRGVSNRLKDFSNQFNSYTDTLLNDPEFDTKYDLSNTAFKNKDTFRNKIEQARIALANGKVGDDDWRALAELGIDPESYRGWFGDVDEATAQQQAVKKDNYKGTPLEDLSKANTKLTDAGFLARTDEKGNVFYLNPDGTELQNGVINEAFNPKTDSLAGWFRVNGNIYNPNEYANWSPEIKNAYNIILNEQDDRTIYDDPVYGELKDKYGYSHVADVSSFFDGFKGELVKAYTRPTVENPSSYKSQYFLNKNGKFTPVNVSYNNILGEWALNDNGTTIRLGKQGQAGTHPVAGSDEAIGFNKTRQFTFRGKDAYSQENVIGLLRRLGDNPNLANDARYRSFIQGLFLPGRLESLKSEEGIPLSDLVKEGRIDFRLVPNEMKSGLKISRDDQGRVTNLSFNTGDGPHSSGSSLNGTGWKGFKPIKTDYNASPLKRKEGGIIKAQWGVSTDYIVDRRKPTVELNEEEQKLNKKATDSYDKTQSIKFDNKDLINEGGIIKTADRVKMGAAMADLLSAGLGFVPGANIASAGIGAASSLAEFGADASDGLEWGEVGNLALNLGMDAVSLIPAMKSIKAMKAMGKLAKFVPVIATAIGAMPLFNDNERESLTSSLKKITSGNIKDLSTDDFKNLATISRVVLGGKNFLKASNGPMTRLRGTRTAPSNKSEIVVNVKGRETPIKVKVNNSEIEGKDAGFIQDLAKKKAKQQLASEGLVEKDIPDDILSIDTKGTDKWYKGKFINPTRVPTTKVKGEKISNPNWAQRHLVPQAISETPKNFGQFWGMQGINPKGKLGWLSDTRWIGRNTPKGEAKILTKDVPQREVRMIEGQPNTEIQGTLLTPSPRRQRLQNKGLTEADLNKRGIYKEGGILKAANGLNIIKPTFTSTQVNTRHSSIDPITKKVYALNAVSEIPSAPIAPKFNIPNMDTSKATIDPITGKVNGLPEIKSTPIPKDPSKTFGALSNNSVIQQLLGKADPTALISAGRMMGNIWNNNRIANKTKEGLKPLLLDSYETPRQVVGDLATRQAYNERAANLESLASKPRTSDASLQLAGELAANAQANQMRAEGALADNDMIRRTSEAAWQNNAESIARRNELANRNRASMLGIDKAKKDIDATRMSANWTSLENFMKGREYKSTIDRDRQKQFDLNVGMGNLQANTEARLKPLRDYLEQQSAKGVDISTLPQYKQYSNLIESLGRDNVQSQNRLYANVYGLRMPNGLASRKKGGQLTYAEQSKLQAQKDSAKAKSENAKLFQKNIEKTIDTNIKMINNLSSVSKQLIIKSMT